MKCVFVKAKVVTDEDGMYGIEVDLVDSQAKYSSITSDRDEIEKIVKLINNGDVSICHIDDVIEDILG